MVDGKCRCAGNKPGEDCPDCGADESLLFWCDTCEEAVPEKRCPLCGLKAKKIQDGAKGRK
jgi:predicted RNA-binding Zn-ribbon protein involved in translation (DUF1610 family)